MRSIKDTNGKEYFSKLTVPRMEEIQNKTGCRLATLHGKDPVELALLMSDPMALWQTVHILVGHSIPDPEEGAEKADVSELFDVDAVDKWLEEMVSDFCPTRLKPVVSKRFSRAREMVEKEPEALEAALAAREDQNQKMMQMAMNSPEILSQLATGSQVKSR